jgi:hypothetical protein
MRIARTLGNMIITPRLAPAVILFALAATMAATMSVVAHAQNDSDERPERIVVTEKECKKLIRFMPGGDVAYKPGVDVHGNKVVGADLPGTQRIQLPDVIAIDITVNIYEHLGITPPTRLGDSSAKIGVVEFKRGKLTFNGQSLGDPAMEDVVAVCRAEFGK